MIRFAIALLITLGASGCASIVDRTTGVSVSGLNYTDKAFSYVFKDPKDARYGAGGETVSPYGGGGVMCCYSLPPEWRPGIKVLVKIYQYNDEKQDRELVKEVLAEVPPYAKGKAGTLWAVLYPDGSVEAISSDVTPDHPQWPGKVKGWPQPSVEYMRFLWDRDVKRAEASVALYLELIQDLEKPEELKEHWKHDLEYNKEEIRSFSGPSAPEYVEWLRKKYERGLSYANRQLENLRRRKP